jgi:hypothetical protein
MTRAPASASALVIRPVPAPSSSTKSPGPTRAWATSSSARDPLRRRCCPLGRSSRGRERDPCAPTDPHREDAHTLLLAASPESIQRMLVRQIPQNPAMPSDWLVRRVPLDVQRLCRSESFPVLHLRAHDREFGYEHHVNLDTLDTIAFSPSIPSYTDTSLSLPRSSRPRGRRLQRVRVPVTSTSPRPRARAGDERGRPGRSAGRSVLRLRAGERGDDAGSVRWKVGTIEVGRPATLRIVARIDAGSRGRIENAARVLGLD